MRKLLRLTRRFGLGRAICLMLLFDLVVLRVWDPAPLEALRLRAFDFYQLIKPREATLRPVTIVDIDEPSLRAHGQWPWPRTLVAELVTALTDKGALAIGFDFAFPERDRVSPGVAAESFRGLDEETRAKLKSLPSNDEVLARTIARSRVILGQSGFRLADTEAAADALPGTGFATVGRDPGPFLVTFPALLRNVAVLEQAAAGRGLFSLRPEQDGIVRRVPIVMMANGALVPALALDMLRVVTGSGAILIRTDEAGVKSVAVPGLEIPTDRNGQLWVHFAPHDPARNVSARDVLAGHVPAERIAGKLVLVGTSAMGLLDVKATPVHPAMPGVEIHAQVLESVLTGGVLAAPNWAIVAELALAIATSLAIVGLAPVLGAGAMLVFGALVAAGVVGVSWYAYSQLNTLFDFTFPLLCSAIIYLMLVFTNYIKAQSERKQIRSAFSQYLSPALVEQLAQSPDRLVLGGEERVMTVLFSDIRGFTSISELYKNDPQGLTSLVNRLLTPLTNAIIDRKGTIDKYIGDAVMAFWNAPLLDGDQEANACEAVLDMLDRVEELNRLRRMEAEASGQEAVPLKIGIGVNTGPCVVGNMGSDLHFNYSVLGDTVNLASRLEGQTKAYAVPVILGARTAQAVQGSFATLELDFLQVKGKTEPELVYTILGRADVAASPRFQRLREANAAMLAAYRHQNWTGALEAILLCKEAGREFGLEEFYNRYVARIRTLLDSPPGANWNGVYAADSK